MRISDWSSDVCSSDLSTRFLCRAVADAGLGTEITAIDPAPRASLAGLPVQFVPAVMQTADPAVFAALQPGDVLFIDSSHILMPGTDVDWLFNRIPPALRSEEHTSELQSLMRISYAVFCLKKTTQ